MSGYGEENASLMGAGSNDHNGASSTSKGCFQTKLFQLVLALALLVILAVSITCCVLLGVFHSHLLFLCSYAEFMTLIVLQGVVIIFCGYHAYHIYRFFAPAQEDDDTKEYNNVGDEEDEEYEEESDFENSKLMKILFFLLKFIGLLISTLAFASLIALTVTGITVQQLTFPQVSGDLKLAGIGATGATIEREPSGVIHVRAAKDADVFFAQGVTVAQERMFQLEFYKRFASGSLAAAFGPGQDDSNIVADKLSRTLGFYRSAQQTWSNLPADVQATITAYVNGINAYLATGQRVAPEFAKAIYNMQPSKWDAIDVVALSKAFAWQLALNVEMEVTRLKLLQTGSTVERINQIYPVYPADGPIILTAADLNIHATQEEIDRLNKKFTNDAGAYIPEQQSKQSKRLRASAHQTMNKVVSQLFGSQRASNAWVVGSKHTKTAHPILANDPHSAFTAPGAYMLMHLESQESGLNAIGATLVGIPGIYIGENGQISWGLTNSAADVQDLYVMKDLDGNFTSSTKYEYNGQSVNFNITQETIAVKGADSVTITIKDSVYGPAVNNLYDITVGPSVCLSYSGFSLADTTLVTYTRVMRAKSWAEFTDAISYLSAASYNYVYADRFGNIGFATAGKIPIRKEGHSGRFPVPGTGEWDYTGYIPLSDMPIVFNPSQGYVVSANNRITPPGYNYSLTLDWESKYRAERIVEHLSTMVPYGNVTVDEVKNLQMDTKSMIFEEYKFIWPLIAGNLSADAETWRGKLENWDGRLGEMVEEPAIFEAWFGEMCKITEDEIGIAIDKRYPMFIREVLKNNDLICLETHNMTCTLYAAMALNESVAALGEVFGGTAPLWGIDVHEVQFNHLALSDNALKCMATKSVFNIGGSETVNVGDTNYPELKTVAGVTYRQVIDLSKNVTEASDSFIIPLGQSGNWLASNYDNYLYSWRQGSYLDMKFVGYNKAATLNVKA